MSANKMLGLVASKFHSPAVLSGIKIPIDKSDRTSTHTIHSALVKQQCTVM